MNPLALEFRYHKFTRITSKTDIQSQIRYALQSAGQRLVNYAKTHHRYEDRTGKLTKSFRYNLVKENGKYVAVRIYQDENEAFYGRYQIGGTGIYAGKPEINLNKNGKFRGYFWQRQNRWVRNPLVRGIPGDNILGNAIDRNKLYIQRDFRDRLEKVVGKK